MKIPYVNVVLWHVHLLRVYAKWVVCVIELSLLRFAVFLFGYKKGEEACTVSFCQWIDTLVLLKFRLVEERNLTLLPELSKWQL